MAAKLQQVFLQFHAFAYQRSNGRVGHRMTGVPALLLITTGRRSGNRRTSALVYAKDGASYVVVASNGGSDRNPAWFFNVTSDPRVEVQVARTRTPARAEIVERGKPEYERLWRLVNDNNHNRYRTYQSHTPRPIPLVVVSLV